MRYSHSFLHAVSCSAISSADTINVEHIDHNDRYWPRRTVIDIDRMYTIADCAILSFVAYLALFLAYSADYGAKSTKAVDKCLFVITIVDKRASCDGRGLLAVSSIESDTMVG